MRRLAPFLFFLVDCTPAIQSAAVTPALADLHDVKVDTTIMQRFAFRSPKARVLVVSNDMVNGDHHLRFTKVRGSIAIDPKARRGHLHVDVAMDALVAESDFITDFASYVLEPARFPHAILDAKLEPIDGDPSALLVTGNMNLHGFERGIVFRAQLSDDHRFRAVFDMSRHAFGIEARPEEGDGLVRDDFTVTFDFRANPERVTAEEP